MKDEQIVRIAFRTDRGPRDNLEDVGRALVLRGAQPPLGEIPLCIVLDGVGGHCRGEVAAAVGPEQLIASLLFYFGLAGASSMEPPWTPELVTDALSRSFHNANQAILECTANDSALTGMATTAVCAVIINGILCVAWAGDSRCYLGRRGSVERITRDHSEVERLVELALIEPEQAKDHPLAHVITHYLGQADGFEIGIRTSRVSAGDVVLLCTDGLTDVVSDDEIAQSIWRTKTEERAFEHLPHRLVERALQSGTQDNVTVLCCEYRSERVSESSLVDRTRRSSFRLEFAKAINQLSTEVNHVR